MFSNCSNNVTESTQGVQQNANATQESYNWAQDCNVTANTTANITSNNSTNTSVGNQVHGISSLKDLRSYNFTQQVNRTQTDVTVYQNNATASSVNTQTQTVTVYNNEKRTIEFRGKKSNF